MKYEWDEAKRLSNIQKHGFDFIDVDEVFNDPNGIEFEDNRYDYNETRLAFIGLYRAVVVTVIIYIDKDECRRIISFRKANKKERGYYENDKRKIYK